MSNLTRRYLESPRTAWDLFREVDQIFGQLQNATEEDRSTRADFAPATDIRENANGYMMAMDVPGFSDKDVKIELKDGTLTVSGERRREQSTKEHAWTRTERAYGRFTRSFVLPKDVDPAKIEAQVENGELMLFLPKGELAKPMAIPVRTKQTEEKTEGYQGLWDRFFAKDVKSESGSLDPAKH